MRNEPAKLLNREAMLRDLFHNHRAPTLLLIAICAFAAWLRLPLVSANSPFIYEEDDGHHYQRVVEMVKEGELNPHYFRKPSLHFYLRIPALALAYLHLAKHGELTSVKEIRTRDSFGLGGYAYTVSQPYLLKASRAFTVMMSLALIIVTFGCAQRVWGNYAVSILAALFCVLSPALQLYSPSIGVDLPMALFAMITIYVALGAREELNFGNLALTGILAGLTISTKYNAAPIALLPILLLIIHRAWEPGAIVIALVTPVLGFLSGSPYIISSLPLFLDHLGYEMWHYASGDINSQGTPGFPQALFYFQWLVHDGLGALLAGASLLGALLLALRRSREGLLYLAFPALYLFLMCNQTVHYPRNMLTAIPLAAACAGYALTLATSWLPNSLPRFILTTFLAIGTSIQPIRTCLKNREDAFTHRDTRIEAIEYLTKSVGPFSDTAVAGKIQLPNPAVLGSTLKGISRFDHSHFSAAELYQAGFDRVLVPSDTQFSEDDRVRLSLEHEIQGAPFPQRVVKDPHLSIFRLLPPTTQELLFLRPKEGPAPQLVLTTPEQTREAVGGLSSTCAQSETWRSTHVGENYCWITQRKTELPFTNIALARLLNNGGKVTVKLRVMSPWPNQTITARLSEWRQTETLSEQQVGKWIPIELHIPYTELVARGSFEVEITQVHSPNAYQVSSDERRLGLAIQASIG